LGTGYYSPNITSISTNTTINFLQGSYQKFSVEGNVSFGVENWPSNTVLGQIRLEIYNASSSTNSSVTFNNVKKEASLTLPFPLTSSTWSNPVMFDLWTSDGGSTVFIDKVLDTETSLVPFLWDPNSVQTTVASAQYAITATYALLAETATHALLADTATHALLADTATYVTTVAGSTQTSITQVGTLTNLNVSGTIVSNTATINQKLTLSSATFIVNNDNIIISGVTGLTIENTSTISATIVGTWGVGPLGTTYIDIDSVDDILIGSTFKLSQTENLIHIVKSVDNVSSLRKRVYVDQYDENNYIVPDDIPGTSIEIKNGNLYNSVYYSSSEPKNLYGKAGDRKGGVYVTTSMVYLSYLDYTNTSTDMWVKVPTVNGVNSIISTLSNTVTTLVSTVASNINSISAINSTVTTLVSTIAILSNASTRWAQYVPLYSSGTPGDKKGDIYANTTTLYVCFQDYVGVGVPCWVKTNVSLW
jgi:hypothetical protein